EELSGLPAGVVLKDASDIIPRKDAFKSNELNTYSVFSDLFRYEGLRRGLGIWCDADALLLRPLKDFGNYLVAWHTPSGKQVNGGVLYLPPDFPFYSDMISIAYRRVPVMPYWPLGRKLR